MSTDHTSRIEPTSNGERRIRASYASPVRALSGTIEARRLNDGSVEIIAQQAEMEFAGKRETTRLISMVLSSACWHYFCSVSTTEGTGCPNVAGSGEPT